jgi:hypothetical protein
LLTHQGLNGPSLTVDSDWYLSEYPDVAAAGVPPLHHFIHHGRAEGRLPCALDAVELDTALWSGSCRASEQLFKLMGSKSKKPKSRLEASYAGWFLARWHAAKGEWASALKAIRICLSDTVLRPGIHTPDLLYVDALRFNNKLSQAKDYLHIKTRDDSHPDWLFATANLGGTSTQEKLEIVNLLYAHHGLVPIDWQSRQHATFFHGLTAASAEPVRASRSSLVSVLMPVFNAQNTVDTALRSVLDQSWRNLEVIVVNDASTDSTAEILKAWAQKDSRVKVFHLRSNRGAYGARNLALSRSNGKFVTVHDSDDWSHPQKIELQVRALLDSKSAKASVSHWIRATEDLVFGGWQYPPNWVSWCHRNTSSLMFRRSVFAELGYWDGVVCSGDTEYYHRIMKAYGDQSVVEVEPSIPLSIGRITPGSLTQAKSTSIFTNIVGLRWNYYQAYLAWHEAATRPKDLYMPANPKARRFPVEPGMLR